MKLIVAIVALLATTAHARTIKGFVFDDTNNDGVPTVGEPGHANAVVAFGIEQFAVTDARGNFTFEIADDAAAQIVWVRAPDGYAPGPIWQTWDGTRDIELALHRLPRPVAQPFSFVVAADTHIPANQTYFGTVDLAAVAREATELDPPPAFFTILGDITQGNHDAEFDHVEQALAGLAMPWVPVPGNHDWWDGGLTWFRRMGPDNYSFDLGGVHFVVWNMARSDEEVRAYLGAELAHADRSMPVVALTHAPPSEAVIAVLRELHVTYLLTGHTHANRVVDHGGLIELGTEPLLMGGLDFTPAGYRVVTVDGGKLTSYHRTVVDEPELSIVRACEGGDLVVATELAGAPNRVSARVDCGAPIALAPRGGWVWSARLPHGRVVEVTAENRVGGKATRQVAIVACPDDRAKPGSDWPAIGGGPAHDGARDGELAPPLAEQWAAPIGGQALQATPAIGGGLVIAVASDLGDGGSGGVTALDLMTGKPRWHVTTHKPIRGGAAIADATVVVEQVDGLALAFDLATGAERWRHALAPNSPIAARTTYQAPTPDGDRVAIANQHELALVAARTGAELWHDDPVPTGVDSQSLASVAIGDGLVVGSFDRAVGGLIAWSSDGKRKWTVAAPRVQAVNASPVIANGHIYVASGDDSITSFDEAGNSEWRRVLDPAGFEWGYATVGTPAIKDGVLVVPTLYRDLVAIDVKTAAELWRAGGAPSPLRTTHYRGKDQAGFEASPVIVGDVVWAADTAGELVARDLHTGAEQGRIALGAPVLGGLAVSGDWLVATTYDGVVHALAPSRPRIGEPIAGCADVPAVRVRPLRVGRVAIAALAIVIAAAAALWRRLRR
ncbi:MAG TPA: PQQ-binding-like beta-propeller repeat protein [Kofleriaceae bacterium]|nr:PQQ-binding-like beta-propeller repeat protein [Kofleriaceae bacterium]